MNKDKLLMLDSYVKAGVSPILLEDIPAEIFEDAIILEGDCDKSLLNGHYEKEEFYPPKWYSELLKKEKPLLVIKDINKISIEEQGKFIELFKYKKVSTFELSKNCIIILTVSNLKENRINEEVYSLVVHI